MVKSSKTQLLLLRPTHTKCSIFPHALLKSPECDLRRHISPNLSKKISSWHFKFTATTQQNYNNKLQDLNKQQQHLQTCVINFLLIIKKTREIDFTEITKLLLHLQGVSFCRCHVLILLTTNTTTTINLNNFHFLRDDFLIEQQRKKNDENKEPR